MVRIVADNDPCAPCLVGTARRTWHSPEAGREPLELWSDVARAAAADAAEGAAIGAGQLLGSIDDLQVVHCQSWTYDDPARRFAERLGLDGARLGTSILAGTSPQRLIDAAVTRLATGESSMALVVGGEAAATRRWLRSVGATSQWSSPHAQPPELPVDLDAWYLPTELAHGILPAWLTFALLGEARWAERGAPSADRVARVTAMARLSRVAAGNPDSWFGIERTPEDLARPTAENRLVASPYTKWMTAFPDVDMAAANLIVTRAVADAWGVPDERRVYFRGSGFARDAVHVAARPTLGSSPAMRTATAAALTAAGVTVDDVDLVDLYSCFPSAIEFGADALGLALDDDSRPLSLTGGLASYGGPGSNYVSHSISFAVERLRSGHAGYALTTGVGMHMTKHGAAVWSSEPGPWAPPGDHGDQRWAGRPTDGSERAVVDAADGEVRVRSASVIGETAASPSWVASICELGDGTRCYARSDDPAVGTAVLESAWVGATAHVRHVAGRNELHL